MKRIGRALMLPIAVLPAAGLLLGIGRILTNTVIIGSYDFLAAIAPGSAWHAVFTVMEGVGAAIFENLPLLFAVGVAQGLADEEKGTAALSAAVAFLAMHSVIGALLQVSGRLADGSLPDGAVAEVFGLRTLDMGIFGGIIVGLGVARLHNNYSAGSGTRSFFGGLRSVPVISAGIYTAIGVLAFFVWSLAAEAAYSLASWVVKADNGGVALYGFLERLLMPFGLERVFTQPFRETSTGGIALIDGVKYHGLENIFSAEFTSPSINKISPSTTRFMSGLYPFVLFGLPGGALALYCSADKRKKAAGGFLFFASLAAIIAGVTEPLEYTFLFFAPVLYLVHCIFAGASYLITFILRTGVGTTFSGGFLDLLFCGILQGSDRTRWVMIPVVGAFYFLIYFFFFSWIIRRYESITSKAAGVPKARETASPPMSE
jgi:PTS system D-glucosamine-specific IIC component